MAASAFVALAHDIVITIGVYALTGFQVSPATIIGLLTILGYSLYDTVVVFDKVRENTAPLLGNRKTTYSRAANLALNQTLVRSINTSLTALLPVAAILVVGTLLLGNGELKDLSLVLFVGMLSGTYSSICIATPVLADLKEREPQYKQLAKQVALRDAGGRGALRKAAKAAAAVGTAGGAVAGGVADDSAPDGTAANGDANGSAANGGASNGGAAKGRSGNGRAAPAGRSPGGRSPGAGGSGPAAAELPDLASEDLPDDDDGAAEEEAVAAAQPAGAGQTRATSASRAPGTRQQPVRRSAAQRRPSGKKKRR
jgi:preprotein translocase subunit SecF